MKELKRTIAALLATLMMTTSFNIDAFGAEEYTDAQSLVIAKVNAAGIMNGTDNGFEGTKTLTRAEAAAIMVRMKGIDESVVKASAGETLFGDVASSHWAAGYINVASSQGIIRGVGAGNFAPDQVVTVAEFTTMSVRALGAGTLVDSMGTWPTNYMNFANEEKLTKDVYKIYTSNAARIDAATIIANTLEASVWTKQQVTNTNEVTFEKSNETILEDTLNIIKKEGVKLTANTKDREIAIVGDTTYDVADGVELATLKSGITYDVWYDADTKVKEVVGIWKAEDSKQKTEFFTEIVKVEADKVTFLIDGEEEEFDLVEDDAETTNVTEATTFTLNEKSETLAKNENAFGTIVLEGNTVTDIYAEEYVKYGVVEEIKNETLYFNSDIEGTVETSSIDLEEEDFEFAVTKDGAEISVSDIEEGDALYFYVTDADKYVISVNNKTVEGVVSAKGTDYVRIDGTKYDLDKTLDINAGDEIKGYINAQGKIVMFEELEGAAGDYAVVTSFREVTSKYSDETEGAVEIELTQFDGTVLPIKEIDLDETKEELNYTDKTNNNKVEVVKTLDNVNGLLGTVVRFNDTKDGYVIEEMMVTKTENTTTTTVSTSKEDDAIIKVNGTFNDETLKFTVGTTAYRLTDKTTVLVVEAGDEDYEKEVKIVEVSDLGNFTSDAFLIDIDEDTNKVDTIVFTGDVSRTTNNQYAVVLNTATIDEEDYKDSAEILLADGTVKTVKYHSNEETVNVGAVIEYALTDDVISDVVVKSTTTAKTGYVLSDNTDTIKIAKIATAAAAMEKDAMITKDTEVLDMAENVIYFTTKDEEFVKAKAGDITEISADAKEVTADKETFCTFYEVSVDNDANNKEIIAIFIAE